jgi:hypothetical protein
MSFAVLLSLWHATPVRLSLWLSSASSCDLLSSATGIPIAVLSLWHTICCPQPLACHLLSSASGMPLAVLSLCHAICCPQPLACHLLFSASGMQFPVLLSLWYVICCLQPLACHGLSLWHTFAVLSLWHDICCPQPLACHFLSSASDMPCTEESSLLIVLLSKVLFLTFVMKSWSNNFFPFCLISHEVFCLPYIREKYDYHT